MIYNALNNWRKNGKKIATVKIGGPATNQRGENFVPGMYLKEGCIITSRGCPNRCWFCSVWRREGNTIRELPITEGWNILDDNILRCSENHVRNVFEMLKKQKHRITFSGGLEAAALKDWHIELFEQIKIDQLFFAYDTPDDLEPLIAAGKKFSETKIKHYQLRTYCLIGFPGDTLEKAELRLKQCIEVGFIPAAMLYDKEKQSRDWKLLQMEFIRPIIIKSKFNTEKYNYDYRK
jgi:hypothetical protein